MEEKSLCVLIVDDNPNDRALIRRALEQEFAGLQMEEIGTPDRLRERLEKGQFDGVVTDYQLRWSDGLELLKQVKVRDPLIPVIMFTNTGTEEVAVEAMKAGLDDYITKKAQNFARLPIALRRALEVSTTRRLAAELESRLQTLLNQLNVGVFRATPEGELLEGNAAFLRLLRQASLDEARRAFAKVLALPPTKRRRAMDEIRSTGKPFEREIELRHETGDSTWVSVSETLTGDNGNTVVDGLMEDITTQKQLNARLQRAMSETHHRVKNSLQIMGALVDMYVMQHDETVPVAELRQLAQHIRALAAIHDLLTLQSKNDMEMTMLSMRAAMEQLMPTVQLMLHGRQMTYEFDDVLLPVRLGTSLAVIINEAIGNAVQHGQGSVHLRLRVKGDRARLEVKDEGPGFPADFDQTQATSTGLELLQHLVAWDMRGQVTFTNSPDGGALLIVEFPVPDAH